MIQPAPCTCVLPMLVSMLIRRSRRRQGSWLVRGRIRGDTGEAMFVETLVLRLCRVSLEWMRGHT